MAHGDYRLDNLFFDDARTVTALDWQITMKSVGGYDFAYFVSQSLSAADRRRYLDDLVQTYLATLADAGISYPEDQFWFDVRRTLLFCLAYPVQCMALDLTDPAPRRSYARWRTAPRARSSKWAHSNSSPAETVEPILSERLSLLTLDATVLGVMFDGGAPPGAFTWPSWWPDLTDRGHIARWLQQAAALDGLDVWQPRAIVERAPMTMIGHAGFHLPPRPLEEALADPSFQGAADPVAGPVVEIGYTIFPAWRRRGFATEAVTALVEWAFVTHGVGAVLASVEERNTASKAVLARVGGFRSIGTCQSPDGSVEIVMRRDGP